MSKTRTFLNTISASECSAVCIKNDTVRKRMMKNTGGKY